MIASSNIKYVLLIAWLAFLVAMTNMREWKLWTFGFSGQSPSTDSIMIQGEQGFDNAGRLSNYPRNRDDDDTDIPNDDETLSAASATIPAYSTDNIVTTVHSVILAPPRLLMYHPSNDTFVAYSLTPTNSSEPPMQRGLDVCLRCKNVLPILIDVLLATRPKRFKTNQPPFQMFFSIADFTTSSCMQDGNDCRESGKNFAPWVHFGSAFRDPTVIPNVQVMPTSNYLVCLWEWRFNKSLPQCIKWNRSNTSHVWDDLTPKVVWRGTGFPFLPQVGLQVFSRMNQTTVPQVPISPRRMAHDWSAENPGGWLDSQIVPWQHKAMSVDEMSRFKYQIDFGGAGGTSWTGTLTKLSMPGLLLHHETPTMDWFYDELRPWHHYVPVRTDLSDLEDRFEWAEAHPEKAKQIAIQGSNFSTWFFSNEKMRHEYEQMSETLGKVVDAYDSTESVAAIMDTYARGKVTIVQHSTCTKEHCDIFLKPKNYTRFYLPPQ